MNLGMESAWLLPALCLLAFLILSMGALWGYARFLPDGGSWLAILAIGSGFVLFWPIAGDLLARGATAFSTPWIDVAGAHLELGMALDPLAVIMLGLVTFVALCVQVYSLGYMRGEAHYTWYFAAHSLFAAAMLGLVLADNFLLLYVAWELVGLCSYLLIGFYYERRSAAEAAKKAFVTTRLGDVGMLIGILLLFRATGTFQMSEIFHQVERGALDPGLVSAAAFLVFMGAMGKSAQFPFHVWLPDAMEGPTPVSALIHAATMVAAGVYLVARTYPLFVAAPAVLGFVTAIGLLTTLLAGSMALVMTDIKKVIAYSTVSKLGFMMVALGAGGAGLTAAIFYLATHGFFKALLFLGAGSVIHSTGHQDLSEVGGLGKKMPVTAGAFLVASLALAGVPPLSGFWSKDEALLAIQAGQGWLVYSLALVSVMLSAAYTGRLWFRLFAGEPKGAASQHAHESPWVMGLPMLALAALSLVSGFVALPEVGVALGLPGGLGQFLFFHEPEPFHFDPGVAFTSTVAALLGLAMAAGFYWQRAWSPAALQEMFAGLHRVLINKYYLDDLYQAVIDRVVLAFGAFIALFDRVVVNDTGVNGTGAIAVIAGEKLKYTETGKLPNYALAMAVGVLGVLLAAALTLLSR
ncbi:MAG: NADH-quinone oxidoreductase subunit L [Chloroflexi bacterium]|nr:NADH-quinone oxidoreductase subunit L [Chloroflexota bacterium]